MKWHEKVAGKLYIIGEYNVLKSGHGAIVAPVNLFLQGTLTLNGHTTIIENNIAYPLDTLQNNCPHQLENTVATINFFNEYLATLKIKPKHFALTIENNLISDEQIKYGLGSSAAAIVLTLKLLNQLYATNLSALILFKMAVLIQKRRGILSSGGDLAATLFDMPLYYVRYDVDWLINETREFPLLQIDWPLLKIRLLTKLPTFVVGWTKETIKPEANGIIDPAFFVKAQTLVDNYRFTYDEIYIRKYQALLETLSFSKKGMMTDRLSALVTSAASLGIAAKISGAGYGDCGIAQVSDPAKIKALTKLWHNEHIKVLNIWRRDR